MLRLVGHLQFPSQQRGRDAHTTWPSPRCPAAGRTEEEIADEAQLLECDISDADEIETEHINAGKIDQDVREQMLQIGLPSESIEVSVFSDRPDHINATYLLLKGKKEKRPEVAAGALGALPTAGGQNSARGSGAQPAPAEGATADPAAFGVVPSNAEMDLAAVPAVGTQQQASTGARQPSTGNTATTGRGSQDDGGTGGS